MATHFHTNHDGLDRVVDGVSAAKGIFSEIFSAKLLSSKHLSTYVLLATIMAVVTATERALEAVQTGFAFEWALLSIVALVAFGLLANFVDRSTRVSQSWYVDYIERTRQIRADLTMWSEAKRDPRVMSDIVAAQARQADTFESVPCLTNLAKPSSALKGNAPRASFNPWLKLPGFQR